MTCPLQPDAADRGLARRRLFGVDPSEDRLAVAALRNIECRLRRDGLEDVTPAAVVREALRIAVATFRGIFTPDDDRWINIQHADPAERQEAYFAIELATQRATPNQRAALPTALAVLRTFESRLALPEKRHIAIRPDLARDWRAMIALVATGSTRKARFAAAGGRFSHMTIARITNRQFAAIAASFDCFLVD